MTRLLQPQNLRRARRAFSSFANHTCQVKNTAIVAGTIVTQRIQIFSETCQPWSPRSKKEVLKMAWIKGNLSAGVG